MSSKWKIQIEDMFSLYNGCVDKLDSGQNCQTCVYRDKSLAEIPCSECYSEMLGMPLNPTKWKGKEEVKP